MNRQDDLLHQVECYLDDHGSLTEDLADALVGEVRRLRSALFDIRDADYRGNPHPSVAIARRALEGRQ